MAFILSRRSRCRHTVTQYSAMPSHVMLCQGTHIVRSGLQSFQYLIGPKEVEALNMQFLKCRRIPSIYACIVHVYIQCILMYVGILCMCMYIETVCTYADMSNPSNAVSLIPSVPSGHAVIQRRALVQPKERLGGIQGALGCWK